MINSITIKKSDHFSKFRSLKLQRDFSHSALNTFKTLCQQSRTTCTFWRGRKQILLLNEISLVKEILSRSSKEFGKTRKKRPVFGDGLVTAEGSEWAEQRKYALSELRLGPTKEREGAALAEIEQCVKEWRDGENSLTSLIGELNLRLVTQLFFGVSLGDQAKGLHQALSELIRPKPSLLSRQSYLKSLKHLKESIRGIIENSQQLSDRQFRIFSSNSSQHSNAPVWDQVSTFLLASADTTSTWLSWALWKMSKLPTWQTTIRDELSTPHSLSFDSKQFPITDSFLNECLRMYPPIWIISREALTHTKIGDDIIRQGTEIVFLPYFLHRDTRYWKDPEVFDPSRFSQKKSYPAFLPFGGGPRVCVGSQMAFRQSRMILGRVLHSFEFFSSPGQEVPEPLFTLRPKHGAKVILKKLKT